MRAYLTHRIGPAVALVVCAVAAWMVTLVNWKPPAQAVVPFVFLALVLALGLKFGRTVGILGSIIAALVFAHSMYEPVGSFRITDPGARSTVAWMLLAGVSLSYLFLPGSRSHGDGGKRSS